MPTTMTGSALLAADRCDRCGAQAYVRVTMDSGSQLLFCAHHGREYEPGLRQVAVSIEDQSGALVDTPGTAPVDER